MAWIFATGTRTFSLAVFLYLKTAQAQHLLARPMRLLRKAKGLLPRHADRLARLKTQI
jgi:hypothetical protein